jgi:hypothetical protein
LTGKDASEFTINQLNLAEYATAPNNLPMAVRGVVHTSSDFIGAAVDGAGYTNNDVDGDDADVVDPFTYTAFVDPSGNSVTRQQLEAAMNARLSAARQGAPPPVVLSVPAGSKYLNGPEYFPLVFNELFPDDGGLVYKDSRSDDRETKLSIEDWADHLLRSADPRWREHAQFAFTIFNMIQKQRVFKSCNYYLKTTSVEVLHATLPFLNDDNIKQAIDDLNAAEFERGYHTIDDITDPNMRAMYKEVFKQLRLVGGRLELTDLSRKHQRQMIYSKQINIGLPDLWLTVNPGDVHSPLVLRLAGLPLNLDAKTGFWQDFPSRIKRQLLAVRNPVAVTLYCNMLMQAIVEGLFGFGRKDKSTHNIFGEPVRSYSFHSEEQDRGTLHYHGFVWLRNRPSPDDFRRMLKDPAFQQRMLTWLEAHVHKSEPQVMAYLRHQRDLGGVSVASLTPSIYPGGKVTPSATAANVAATNNQSASGLVDCNQAPVCVADSALAGNAANSDSLAMAVGSDAVAADVLSTDSLVDFTQSAAAVSDSAVLPVVERTQSAPMSTGSDSSASCDDDSNKPVIQRPLSRPRRGLSVDESKQSAAMSTGPDGSALSDNSGEQTTHRELPADADESTQSAPMSTGPDGGAPPDDSGEPAVHRPLSRRRRASVQADDCQQPVSLSLSAGYCGDESKTADSAAPVPLRSRPSPSTEPTSDELTEVMSRLLNSPSLNSYAQYRRAAEAELGGIDLTPRRKEVKQLVNRLVGTLDHFRTQLCLCSCTSVFNGPSCGCSLTWAHRSAWPLRH